MTIEQAIEIIEDFKAMDDWTIVYCPPMHEALNVIVNEALKNKKLTWIPCSECLPENTDPVNITWVNHDPASYYADIKDKPFTATGHYYNGRWWWYSVTSQDYLDEYGGSVYDALDEGIEVIAWMPLPQPYEPQESEDKE